MPGEVVHFLLWGAYGLRVYELTLACEESLGWDTAQALALLSGLSEASSEPSYELAELAIIASRSPTGRAAIKRGGADVLQRLREAAPEVADATSTVTATAPPATTLATQRWPRGPNCWRGCYGTACGRTEPGRSWRRPPASVRRPWQGPGPWPARSARERERFEQALGAAELAHPVREDSIVYADNVPCALIRYGAMEAGRRLAARGVLLRASPALPPTARILGRRRTCGHCPLGSPPHQRRHVVQLSTAA